MASFKFTVSSDEVFGAERTDRVRCAAVDVAGIAAAISARIGKPVSSFDIDFHDEEDGWLRLNDDEVGDLEHIPATVKLRLRNKQAAGPDTHLRYRFHE